MPQKLKCCPKELWDLSDQMSPQIALTSWYYSTKRSVVHIIWTKTLQYIPQINFYRIPQNTSQL